MNTTLVPKTGKSLVLIALAAVLGLLLSACGGGAQPQATAPSPSAESSSAGGAITVLAAASLTEAFTQIGKDVEAKNPGTKVTFSFGSSATLATQIVQGAPADVFAAASPATMKTVTAAGAANTPKDFVSNTLEIAVPKGNPHKITGLKDFGDESRRIALCAPQVPCGAAAVKVFAVAKIVPKPDTLEQDVKATLQKVASDEVDAALVYKTDVIAAGDTVDGIQFPEAQQAINTYPIATLKNSKNPAVAQAFVDYVFSPEGQAVLAKAGFAQP
jgi:molybdate transport system substrate-binding protein